MGVYKARLQRRDMRAFIRLVSFTALSLFTVAGCARESTESPDVAGDIRSALDQAGLRGVHVSQDRDKGVVTLSGDVRSGDAKSQAESIAKSVAAGQVVSDEVAVVLPGDSDAKTIRADLDKGIDKNLDAALIQNRLNKAVSHDAKNGVVVLNGEVNSEAKRLAAQKIAASIPNVQQVINELDVKNQKATAAY
jgi:hyperosmotically inducible protein